jgi:hypothetical protein
MQDVLNQPLLVGRSITVPEYLKLCEGKKNHEYVLFGDNTLECLTLLNPLVDPVTLLNFVAIVHLPLDQPIYVFEMPNLELVSVKVSGSYTNWRLPSAVSELINRYDLPDFALYSLSTEKVIFAGELTETASVGNSQWQRELRKIAAAELKVPFIYQTVYSGKDDSQNTIREPTSLLVYNAMIYSIRYKIASQVLFIESNNTDSATRERKNPLNTSTVSDLLASHLIESSTGESNLRIKTEKKIYEKMLEFLAEPKYRTGGALAEGPRLHADYPCAPIQISESILTDPSRYTDELLNFLNQSTIDDSDFLAEYPWAEISTEKLKPWTDKKTMDHIEELFKYVEENGKASIVAPLSKFSVGIANSSVIIDYLRLKPGSATLIEKLSKYKETLVVPVLLHKKNYGSFQYCKDPYAGNTAAFCELLGYDTAGNKIRGIFAFCVSENPAGFDFHQKYATNLYRSIAKYSDGIILDNKVIISEFKHYIAGYEHNNYRNLLEIEPSNTTEDSGLTSTYLQLATKIGGWRVCMIAIHHSSWQQVQIVDVNQQLKTGKIGRNDAKVDLLMQDKEERFLVAEGKRSYANFFSSAQEKIKIHNAFKNISKIIDDLYASKNTKKITSLICMLDVPALNSDFFLDQERRKIVESIKLGHVSEITDEEFVVIGVYVLNSKTLFELFFSQGFDENVANMLRENFGSK